MASYRDIYDYTGVKVDRHWFCCNDCVWESMRDDPPTASYPRPLPGSITTPTEHPQACAVCQEPAGNPLTRKGLQRVIGWVAEGEPGADKYARLYGVPSG